MSQVNVINVIAHNAKAPFLSKISFEIFFEALQPLSKILTWRIVYIGQASDPAYDQVLEEAEMDELQAGQMKFIFEGNPPDVSKILQNDIVGVTGILLTCSYNNQEFFRVGYYVNNFYEEQELNENQPPVPILDKLTRHILVEKPRVTKFQIQWEDEAALMQQQIMYNLEQQQQEGMLENGSQFKDRNDMMSSANIAQAAQSFFGQ
eukprot:403342116